MHIYKSEHKGADIKENALQTLERVVTRFIIIQVVPLHIPKSQLRFL